MDTGTFIYISIGLVVFCQMIAVGSAFMRPAK